MQGLMQDVPLTLPHFFERAEQLFFDKEIVTATATGLRAHDLRRLGRAHPPARRRARRPRHQRGRPGGHLRLEHGPPPRAVLRGAVHRPGPAHAQHPAVPRAAHLHRQPRRGRGHLRRPVAARAPVAARRPARDRPPLRGDGRRQGRGAEPRRRAGPIHDYEDLLAAADPVDFGVDDENRAASMCYTSGTTGNPKGVVYSHRSTYLHTLGAMTVERPRRAARPTASCRSCRCSTPTPGASPTPPCRRAPAS